MVDQRKRRVFRECLSSSDPVVLRSDPLGARISWNFLKLCALFKSRENAKIENLSVMPQNSYPCSEVAWISLITLLFAEFLMNLMASIRWSGLSENSSFAWFALWR